MLPDYDKERVYTSHMQKVVSWYNLLVQHNMLDFSEPEEIKEDAPVDETPGDEAKPE